MLWLLWLPGPYGSYGSHGSYGSYGSYGFLEVKLLWSVCPSQARFKKADDANKLLERPDGRCPRLRIVASKHPILDRLRLCGRRGYSSYVIVHRTD